MEKFVIMDAPKRIICSGICRWHFEDVHYHEHGFLSRLLSIDFESAYGILPDFSYEYNY